MRAVSVHRQHLVFGTIALALAAVAFQPRKPAPVPEVSISQAVAMVDAGALVIDVRERAVSGSAHLPGAMLVPFETLSSRMPQLREAAAERLVVVYCSEGMTRGPEATRRLRDAGVDAHHLRFGATGWSAAGMPMAKPVTPKG